MGVPAFFRWLSLKYPKIVSHSIEEKGHCSESVNIPVDTSLPNPNKIEFDNLYLDMNGIIHPCTHPENKPAPKNEEEMFVEIFLYIDRIFSVVRPRRLIYMAVDGVAPRAKMNQQRSRRFRAGKETREKHLTIERIRSALLQKGAKLPDPKNPSEHFDSNCITPGTPFMARLTIALQYYVYKKLNSDPGWKNIQVILSDASAPGEGEHKIMDYIRRQRASVTHDPNTKHCLCGADADLIMLGLATHEPHFTIIREEFKPNQPRSCEICGQLNHVMSECTGLAAVEFNTGVNQGSETEFIFLHINILREYLKQELVMPNIHFPYDFERAIDDWVFMCFFVGNDFLPHLPSLEIREKAIDRLISIYKSSVSKTNGWLTDSGRVNISRVQLILKDLALLEDEIFKSRRENEMDFRKKNKERRKRTKRQKLDDKPLFNQFTREFINPSSKERFSRDPIKNIAIAEIKGNMDSKEMAQNKADNFESPRKPGKRKFTMDEKDEEEINEENLDKRDEVKLWEEGYRSRYYKNKFGVSCEENPEFCVNVAHQYLRGLCWVFAYYYQGCVSWTWYYPYHYAPFAIDFVDLVDADIDFEKDTKPFNPLEQLMGVFPADSKSHIPPAWQNLMTDSESPVIDFYPTDFKIDLNGKRYDWQGVALLPFVDEQRLLPALKERNSLLTDEEKERNVIGPDRYFVRSDHPVAEIIKVIYELDDKSDSVVDPKLTNGVTGRIWTDERSYQPGSTVKSPVGELCDDIMNIEVISCFYKDPTYPKEFIFSTRLLDKVTIMPVSTIGPNGIKQDRRSFDTKPMNRMVRHSLNNSYDQQSMSSSNYGPSPNNKFHNVQNVSHPYSRNIQGNHYNQSFNYREESRNNYNNKPFNNNYNSPSNSNGRGRNQQFQNGNRKNQYGNNPCYRENRNNINPYYNNYN